MSESQVRITDVIVDCRDPERLAAFWSAVLGSRVKVRIGPYVFLDGGAGPGMGFQRSDTPGTGKNRVHLDLRAVDPRAEQRRIEELGGRRLPEYAEGGFLVMADPEGNVFCILPEQAFDVDDAGRADYLGGA
ncbi:VOC family protein [Streptomonospora litoralis]|nr:VOC family protein [Streptomonospora litoralis]